jgi:hypothetical protein
MKEAVKFENLSWAYEETKKPALLNNNHSNFNR